MPYKDPVKRLENARKYRANNKAKMKAYHDKSMSKPHIREHNRTSVNRRHNELRMKALIAYSGAQPYCACCGENHVEFLAIDHINGNGAAERKVLSGQALLLKLETQSYPPGYRVLCHNCNCSLGFYGYCPHDKETHVIDNSFLDYLDMDERKEICEVI